jgi:hypothetical protein
MANTCKLVPCQFAVVRKTIDSWLEFCPAAIQVVIGSIARVISSVQTCHSFSSLVCHGLPMLKAVSWVGNISQQAYKADIIKLAAAVMKVFIATVLHCP